MIQVIGIKRITILLILFSFNAFLAASIYLYAIPEGASLDRKLRTLKSQVRSVGFDIERMQADFEQLDQQRDSFDELKANGFFTTQVRSDAKKLFSVIQDESGVIAALVSVKSGTIVDSKEARKANHKILRSPISVELKAIDDAAIYRYIDIAKAKVPGHLSLENITITRTRDVNSATMRAISAGANPELVKAIIKFSWRTLIPDSQVIVDDESR